MFLSPLSSTAPHTAFSIPCLFSFCQFLILSSPSMVLTLLKALVSTLQNVTHFGFICFFLMIRMRLCIFGKDPKEIICSQWIISQDSWCWSISLQVMLNVIPWLGGVCYISLDKNKKLLFFPFVDIKYLVRTGSWDYANILFLTILSH